MPVKWFCFSKAIKSGKLCEEAGMIEIRPPDRVRRAGRPQRLARSAVARKRLCHGIKPFVQPSVSPLGCLSEGCDVTRRSLEAGQQGNPRNPADRRQQPALCIEGATSWEREQMPEIKMVGFHGPRPPHQEMIGTVTRRFATVEAMLSDETPDLVCGCSPKCRW